MASRDSASKPDEGGTSEAGLHVGTILQQARDVALAMAQKARGEVRLRLDEQRHGLAHGIDHVGAAVGRAADTLEQQGHGSVARYVDRAGNALHDYSRWLDARSLDDMATSLESAVRHRPMLFVAGFFMLGFLSARIFKSTSPNGPIGAKGDAR